MSASPVEKAPSIWVAWGKVVGALMLGIGLFKAGYEVGHKNGIDAVNSQDREQILDLQGRISNQTSALEASENRLKDTQAQLQQWQVAYNKLRDENLALTNQLAKADNCAYLEKELDAIPTIGTMDLLNSSSSERDAYAQERGRLQTLLATCMH